MRAGEFGPEDSEHLHQRASELAVYVHVVRGRPPEPVTAPLQQSSPPPEATRSLEATPSLNPAPLINPTQTIESAPSLEPLPSPATAAPISSSLATASAPAQAESLPSPTTPAPAPASASAPVTPPATVLPPSNVVAISDLFYAEGASVVSGGVPQSASAKSDLLGASIEALESLTARPLAEQVSTGPMVVVPVDTLLYRGRGAIERAAAIREQIKASGGNATPAALDEMYDLIGLALKD